MHIPDGVLPLGISVAGYATTAGATWFSLKKINQKEDPREGVPKAALLTAGFFVASWIHIPIPPTSIHLVLNGLMGVVLGYYAFPSILIGLFLQAILFQHGGITSLGVNATMMGVPALLAYFIFQSRVKFGKKENKVWTNVTAFLGGALGLGIAALIAYTLLITSIPSYLDAATEKASILAMTLGYLPLMVIEGVFTVLIVNFLQKVKPELLENE